MPQRGEPGRTVRAAHLGYDLYVTGQFNSSVGRVRIVQRPTRLPPNVTDELRSMLPIEMVWPQKDIHQAMACVDACLTMDIGQLKRWKEQFPESVFGYERYIDWLERLRAAQGTRSPNASGRGGPGKMTPIQLSHFPSQVMEIIPYHALEEHTHVVKIAVVKFQDHTSALRFTLYGKLCAGAEGTNNHDLEKLSRAYVDPVDGNFDIIEHYPGRYKALELPETLLHEVLGVRSFQMHRREGTMKRRAEIPGNLEGAGKGAKGESRMGSPAHAAQTNHANVTMGESLRVQAAAFPGQVREPKPRQRRKTFVSGSDMIGRDGAQEQRVIEEGVVP